MDEDAAKQTPPETGDPRGPWSWRRPARSGEGMASVIEHLREHLRERRREDDEARDSDPDDTRAPAG